MVLRFLVENAGAADAVLEEPESWTAGLEIVDPDGKALKAPEKSKGTPRTVAPGGFFGRAVDVGSVLKVPEDREGWYRFKWTHAGATSSELRVLVLRDWVAAIETTLGTIRVDFRPDLAPEHVLRFTRLAREGFYEGSTFHRVIPGFMMQGGRPKNPANELKTPLAAEFSGVRHVFGTLSMARTADRNSATNEFFICFGPAAHLDGQYSVFGGLVDGHDVVKRVEKVKSDHNPCAGCGRVPAKSGAVQGCCGVHHQDRPAVDVVIKKISLSVRKS
jgi:cyclophilin family peptidyl-prolyl cis-trans isomerase